MNEKITLPSLVALLAQATGATKRECEDLVRELFQLISGELQRGESVKIKDLGVFKLVDVEPRKSVDVNSGAENRIPAHKKVIFVPCKELAAAVNAPFEMFETIELTDGDSGEADSPIEVAGMMPVSEIEEQMESPEALAAAMAPMEELRREMMGEDAPLPAEESKEEEEIDREEIEKETIEESASEASEEVSEPTDDRPDTDVAERVLEQISEDPVQEPDEKPTEQINERKTEDTPAPVVVRKERFLAGFLSGAACMAAIGLLLYFFLIRPNMSEVAGTQEDTMVVATEIEEAGGEDTMITPGNCMAEEVQTGTDEGMEEVAPTQPSDQTKTAEQSTESAQPVYDTITETRYLGTMAKAHYGNYHFWPYIYMENQAKLGHPDRIRPGTKIVIPPLSKYGVNPNRPEDVEKAKRKGVEIYERYR